MKISVVGAGNVGASIAYALCMRELCDEIALVDIFGDVARAKAIDLAQSSCVFNAKTSVCGGDDFVLIEGSDIVIVTAGSPRKEGQTREDLLLKNAVVVKQTAQKIAEFAKNAVIIVVTNPLDVMVWTAHKFSGFSKNKVIGMAGELDSARCRYELALLKDKDASKLRAKIVGAHNDEMIVAQENINLNLSDTELETLKKETSTGGAKIVKLLGTSAYYAPAAAAVKMCEMIVGKSDEIISASVLIDDELSCGRLVRLGRDGLKEILELNLDEDEQEQLNKSEAEIRKNIKFLKENLE
ncbi:malate dehydrogenase [Campylobacter concisus]|uniref:lactate/malate family dehydrogenase n=1 Tax=Campylobacter concisus TaxID=199 RepID=UPI000D383949|nr:malate dehydrogenase [Campylobacter concisus]MCA6130807.1 malate dehydrogenase [Campylobacter concisus]MCA6132483.1 malate dehydrogenase [Campylobacter concisus]